MKDIINCDWLPNENWKHYESHYYISDMGRAFSTFSNKILKPTLNAFGYYTIEIKGKTTKIHRLVGDLFVPNDILERDCLDHINNIKTDNRAENLQWLTRGENTKKAGEDGLNSFNRKETIEIDLDGNIIRRWESVSECSRETGLCRTSINKVCSGEYKQTSNRIFRYAN